MEKTYIQKVHFKIVIEGEYSCSNLLKEELFENADETHDAVWNYLHDNILDYLCQSSLELTGLKTIEWGDDHEEM